MPIVVIAAIAFGVFAPVRPTQAQSACADYRGTEHCVERVRCEVREGERHFITNPSCACNGDCGFEDFALLAVEASRYIFGIAGSLALLMFAVGGFWWLTAGGSSERIGKGKQTLVAAVTGLLIIFGAWVIVNTLLAALTNNFQAPGRILTGDWARQVATQHAADPAPPPEGG